MMPVSSFRLKVQQQDQMCWFELLWGQGRQLVATLPYPAGLTQLYQEWQRAYLSFYKTAEMPVVPIAPSGIDHLRGWSISSGSLAPAVVDWHTKLVEAETKLLNEFHHWLRSAELFEIRSAIAHASRELVRSSRHNSCPSIQVFLTCTPIELARFPWEVWEIGSDFTTTGTIRLMRTPTNIRAEVGSSIRRQRQGRARILAILGDDTGLNFHADREAVKSLGRLADVQFVGWQPGQTATDVKEQISRAISDSQGWDILFFAGHSNETAVTGGELGIAPGVSMSIRDLTAQLETAKNRGLQVAIFNSCSGLDIAESLINLGFSQVLVMREPIHNRVAQEFLAQFLRNLAEHNDIHESLLATNSFLRLEKNLTYPSAYLVPSLFCHPGAESFCIPPFTWKRWLQKALPTRFEAIALTTCIALSLIPSVQTFLLDQRIWLQAVYRDLTGQLPPATRPPVTLVQVDEASVRRDKRIAVPTPINRDYLADLVNRLTSLNAHLIGIDYLLNRSPGNQVNLQQSLQAAVKQRKSWFVFGAPHNDFELGGIFVDEKNAIAKQEWSLQGYVSGIHNRVALPYPDDDCRQICPFGYLLSLIQLAHQEIPNQIPQPQLENQTNLQIQLADSIEQQSAQNSQLKSVWQSRLMPISSWSYEMFGQVWLEPLIDFSIPPDRVYTRIAAWRLLSQEKKTDLPQLASQVVLIGAGEYDDVGGAVGDKLDLYPVPAAVDYWRDRLPRHNPAAAFPYGNSENTPAYLPVFTGAEVHAYTIHHLLTGRLLIPVPDLWMVGVAVLLGKRVMYWQQQHQWTRKRRMWFSLNLVSASALYGLIGLQLYISASVLLPWVLPTIVIWTYVLPTLRKKINA